MGKTVEEEYRKQLTYLSFDFYQMWSFVCLACCIFKVIIKLLVLKSLSGTSNLKSSPASRIRTMDRLIAAKPLQSGALPTELLSEVPTYLQLLLLTKFHFLNVYFFDLGILT